MNNLYSAIYSYFIAEPHNDFYTAIGGRLFYGEAPQEGATPYAVFFGITAMPGDTFGETIDDISIQFNCYSGNSSSIEVGELLEKCRALFDKADLEVSGNRDVQLFREMSTPPWKNGGTWVSSIEFKLLMQEA